MSYTALDPNTALIVVDLQKGIAGLPLIHSIESVVERSCALLQAFRQYGLPVVLVNVDGMAPGRTERPRHNYAFPEGWTDFIPELDQQPSDIVITKRTWGAFANTTLEKQLKALGVTQVVVTGVSTGTGVEATARQAYEHGFNVSLVLDAMTDMHEEAHDYSIKNVFPKLGETGTAQDIIDLLATRSA
ncbi:isochorismatase family protein [Trinickia sp. YCB016]